MTRYALCLALRLLTALAIACDVLHLFMAAKLQLGRQAIVRRLCR